MIRAQLPDRVEGRSNLVAAIMEFVVFCGHLLHQTLPSVDGVLPEWWKKSMICGVLLDRGSDG
jgi:hypothetical protein